MKCLVFGALLWLLVTVSDGEGKRKRPKGRERSFQDQCRRSKSSHSASAQGAINGPLRLHAFLDFTKGVVCFKVESCNRPPVCIVETSPQLKRQRLNNCSLWNQFTSILSQAPTRKIEPVIVGELSKHIKRSGPYQTRREWPDEIYSLCRRTIVYRFIEPNPQNSTSSTTRPPEAATSITSSPPSGTRPTNAKNRRNVRPGRRRNHGRPKKFDLPPCKAGVSTCERICVGQNRQQRNSAACSAFKISCKFDSFGEGAGQPRPRGRGKKNKAGRTLSRD